MQDLKRSECLTIPTSLMQEPNPQQIAWRNLPLKYPKIDVPVVESVAESGAAFEVAVCSIDNKQRSVAVVAVAPFRRTVEVAVDDFANVAETAAEVGIDSDTVDAVAIAEGSVGCAPTVDDDGLQVHRSS